jgi:Tfp pilus assembly protein PilN
MRRCTGFDIDQTRRQLMKDKDIATLQLLTDDHLANRINAVNLENRLGNVETDCRNRLHDWLLRMVAALTAPTFMALTCRWWSRPQHQERTKDNAFQTSRLHVQSRTGHSADKGLRIHQANRTKEKLD